MSRNKETTIDLTKSCDGDISREILKVLQSVRIELREDIQEFRRDMKDEVHKLKIQNEEIIRKTHQLEEKIEIVDKKYATLPQEIEILNSIINNFKQKELINDILITGLPINQDKSLMDTVMQYLNIFNKQLDSTHIEFAYRFKQNNESRSFTNNILLPVVVRFKNYDIKRKLLKNQKELGAIHQNQILCEKIQSSNSRKVIIHQRLTPLNYQLLQRSRNIKKDFGYKFVWITESYNIFILKEEKGVPIKVTSMTQLENIQSSEIIL